jgi:hypothetical protein
MNRYYVEYPRDFANEYTVYAVPAADAERFERFFPSADRISRAEAVRLGTRRPIEAKRDGEQWFGGWLDGQESMTRHWNRLATVTGRIDAAVADTLAALYRCELEADWKAGIDAELGIASK